jgi:hypothetical protein
MAANALITVSLKSLVQLGAEACLRPSSSYSSSSSTTENDFEDEGRRRGRGGD